MNAFRDVSVDIEKSGSRPGIIVDVALAQHVCLVVSVPFQPHLYRPGHCIRFSSAHTL